VSSGIFRKKSIDSILQDADSESGKGSNTGLKRVLGVRDLTFLGIAVIIGAGVFSSIGKACYDGGPAVIGLYIFIAIACGFAALCYAQFAGSVPASGSAYTYGYVAFGEIFAWLLGWSLVLEYAIGNIAIAISWSDYFTRLLQMGGMPFPSWLTMDHFTASAGYQEAVALLGQGKSIASLDPSLAEKYSAWKEAPQVAGIRIIGDLPAFMIVVLLTYVVYIGISQSKKLGQAAVILKLLVILMVILLGAYYIDPNNWIPFAPNGAEGVMKGVGAVFFAYLGFDALSTTAEECKDPKRDLPRGIIYALLICTFLYIIIALVLTGMAPYHTLNVGDPLAKVFHEKGMYWISGIIAVSAIIATGGVLLVCQLAQPRIWMSMGRDGLLPKPFARIHPKYKTPSFSTLLTGLLVSVSALFLNLELVLSICSIGTLFAFSMVCGGVLMMGMMPQQPQSSFMIPYINGRIIVSVLLLTTIGLTYYFYPGHFRHLFSPEGLPMLLFWSVFLIIAITSFLKKFSLIPSLGVITCVYLMAQENHITWLRFVIWLAIGIIIYFLYGKKHSKLNNKTI
jgi:amino acid transporter